MDLVSLPFLEAANLATPTVLNALEMSITALHVSQDLQLILNQKDVFLRLNVLMVSKLAQVFALIFVIPDFTSTKASVFMEDASMGIPLLNLEDA